jgi:hypothetical protein
MAIIQESKYKGMTKRAYKRMMAAKGTNSTPGLTKGENCQATSLDKAMARYSRAWKTNPTEYINHNKKKHKVGKYTNKSFFDNL